MKRAFRHFTSKSADINISKKIALLFPGQGAQQVGMGKDIYENFKIAKETIEECEQALGLRLKNIMFEGPQHLLNQTANAQPALVCHSISLLRVLQAHFGFKLESCSYAMGHSLGEYSALVATNSIPLADAIKLVRLRGEAMQNCVTQKTSMRALMVSGNHLDDIIDMMPHLSRSLGPEVAEIANVNSRSQVVLSGTEKGVEYAASVLHSKGFTGRSLAIPVSAPFHCSLMAPAATQMESALANIKFNEPEVEVISNVTGRPFLSSEEIPKLLTRQIVETVHWQRCMQYAKDDLVFDWIVVGPSRVLSNLIKKEYPDDSIQSISFANDLNGFQI